MYTNLKYLHGGNIQAIGPDGIAKSIRMNSEDYAAVVAAYTIAPADPEPTGPSTAEIMASYAAAIEAHVDATARGRSYSGAVACATYAASGNPVWKAEATAFIAWRDAVWGLVLAELAAVQAATKPAPELGALIASLPAMVWPN